MAMAAANDVPIAQLITNDALIQPAHSTLLAGLDYRNVSLLETAFGLYNVSLNQANNPEIDLDPAQRPSHFAQLVGEFLWITAMNQPSLSDDIGALTAGIYILNDIESPSFETTYGPVAEGFWDAFHGETSTHYRWMYDQNRIRQRPNLLLYTQWFGLNSLEASYVQTVSAMRLRNDIYFSLEDSFFVLARLEEKFEDEDARDVNVDADIPAAGAWFLHAGRVIFQACQQGETGKPKNNHVYILTGWMDFNMERWRFWKTRFSVAAHLAFARDDTKQVAQSVVDTMTRIESRRS